MPWLTLAVLACFLYSISVDAADIKRIRLRNEVISTAPAQRADPSLRSATADQLVSGLYLVQFNDQFQAPWRDQLRDLGVDLIRFVPDDAFVARFNQVRLGPVRALPFVRWIGAYRPELKILGDLHPYLDLNGQLEPVAVSVLLSPDADLGDLRETENPGQTLQVQSRSSLGTVLQGRVNSAQLSALTRSEAVLWIEPAPRIKLSDEISSKIVAGGQILSRRPGQESDPSGSDDLGLTGPPAASAAAFVNETATQQLGYDGRGVVVAVADTGLHNGDAESMHPDLADRVDAFLFYGPLLNAADEHGHGTHVTGIIAGSGATGELDDTGALYGLGVAPMARLVVQRIFDGEGKDEMPPLTTLAKDAVRAGAIIGSNSWGDDVQGRYDLNAAQVDALVRDADPDTPGDQPFILQFSAGNAGPGPQTLDSPALGKNVIATGASQNERWGFFTYSDGLERMADFSSRGPCEDGRIKPDLVAPGTWIASLQSGAAGDANAWSPISGNYQYQGGTSQAGPHVSGAAAVFVQYYRETQGGATPSPALVKAALINSAVAMAASKPNGAPPNFDEGWGRVALTNLIGAARRVEYVDQTNRLAAGEVFERTVIVASPRHPFKVTLAYTDVPGLPAALPALVNDLDLEVVGPDGRLFLGNQFLDGESADGAAAPDDINNVEGVQVREPVPGDYLVRVRARSVVEDVFRRDDVAPQQDFALVIGGDLAVPGFGILVADRVAYSAPGTIHLKLIDADLLEQPSVPLLVKSSTEPDGEVITLRNSGAPGIFIGALETSIGTVAPDGRLQIRDRDIIEAVYEDASPPGARTVRLRADLTPPQIANLALTNRFGKEVISWETDEPTMGIVVYQTNRMELFSATNRVFQTQHHLELENLVAGARYQFYVVAVDLAGNKTTNDNGGQLYAFTARPAATVLLVNAHIADDPSLNVPEVPLATYTSALDKNRVSYELWDLTEPHFPSPSSSDLRPFPVVIWRISDSLLGNSTLTPAQQAALESYVKGGGALFIASMELLSRLGEQSSFRTNVLRVRGFDENAGVPAIYGEDHDPISNGVAVALDYSAYDNDIIASLNQPPDVSDTLRISASAAPIFFDQSTDRIAGLRYPRNGNGSDGRLVFLAFPFDAVPEEGDPPGNRSALMRRILSFLAPGLGGLGMVTLDRAAYPVPDLVTIEVADSDLAGHGRTTVKCFSDSMPSGVSVDLPETARRGLFRGSITLTSGFAPAAIGALRVQPGDAIRAEYYDSSSAVIVTAHAVVDVQHPTLSELTIVPAHEEATARWTTSEPTDALVQFGESTFLGRTAYSAEFAREHELTLVGLKPGRTYYYQVVSRDRAGNTALENNDGKFYTFRTLNPRTLPWFDTVDSAGASQDWLVMNGEDSPTAWTLGLPGNGMQPVSPPNAWGSNLEGGPILSADTTLVSPAIQLTGGNVARLTFWHSYDFRELSDMDIYESGRLLISSNNGRDWASLREYAGWSGGWKEEQVDLTPYLGRVIQLGWAYSLYALEAIPRPGWLVDDVSVTMTNLALGTIQVSNNLAQASFILTGPISRNGQGLNSTFQNVPSGEYVVQFNEVPFYDTPPTQTNVVSANSVIFQGQYTFADLNQNGISDAWEEFHFGSVPALHDPASDDDRDGFSNYAEFMAGTDPADPESSLQLLVPVRLGNRNCRINWTTTPGRNYRVLTSEDATSWAPLSGWLRAAGYQLSYTVVMTADSNPLFFRLEVVP